MDSKNYAKELMDQLQPAIQRYLDDTPELAAIEVELSYMTTTGDEGLAVRQFDLKTSDR